MLLPHGKYKENPAATEELDRSQVEACPATAFNPAGPPAGATASAAEIAAAIASPLKRAIQEVYAAAHVEEVRLLNLAYALSKRPPSSISLGGVLACAFCQGTTDVHGCHIAALKYFDPSSAYHRREFRVLLADWHENRDRMWQHSFTLNHPMNLLPLCIVHQLAFDSNKILLIFAPIPQATFVLVDRVGGVELTLPEVYTSVISHRAVMFRLERVMEDGIALPPMWGSLPSIRDRSRGQSDASGATSDDCGLPTSVS